eukprot:Nk52_evm5s628 gene=Nk52_evmTU5s628
MGDLSRAVLCSLDPQTPPSVKQQAFQYCEQVKNSERGWRMCLDLFVGGGDAAGGAAGGSGGGVAGAGSAGSDGISAKGGGGSGGQLGSFRSPEETPVRFFCLQVIEEHLRTRYVSGSVEDKQYLKMGLWEWLTKIPQQRSNSAQFKEPTFLRNKFAQIVTLLATHEYPSGLWSNFFNELLAATMELGFGGGALGGSDCLESIDMYLRILLAVDEEVVAREIARNAQDAARNVVFKDCMREQCMPQLVESWYTILSKCTNGSGGGIGNGMANGNGLSEADNGRRTIVNACLAVVSLYIDWIDIDLIVNERFMTLFFQFISMREYRENSASCFISIVNKGMESSAKINMIQQLNIIPLLRTLSENVVTSLNVKQQQQKQQSQYSSMSNLLDTGTGPNSSAHSGKEMKTRVVNGIIVVETEGDDDDDDNGDDEETDFSLKLTKLVSTTGSLLTTSYVKMVKGETTVSGTAVGGAAGGISPGALNQVEGMIESVLQIVHLLLGIEDDEIVTELLPFALSYVNILKMGVNNDTGVCSNEANANRSVALTEGRSHQVQLLLHALCMKMRFDDSYDFEKEDEEEFLFQEVRKDLKQVFDNIAIVSPDLVLNYVHMVVSRVLGDLGKAPLSFANAELALNLLDHLNEAVPGCSVFTEEDVKTLAKASKAVSKSIVKNIDTETAMKRTLVVKQLLHGIVLGSPNISCFPHRAVSLEFFEIAVKYHKFFITEPQGIQNVLTAFLDQRGIRNPNRVVASRCCYLFLRFCKSLRNHLGDYVETIMGQLGLLLDLQVDENAVAEGKAYIRTEQGPLGYEDQLFLYEAVGRLAGSPSVPSAKQSQYFAALFEPIVQNFEAVKKDNLFLRDNEKQPVYGMFLYQLISCAVRLSKGFSTAEQTVHSGAAPYLLKCLDTFVQVFDVQIFRSELAFVCRQYIHRMISCLGRDIFPFVPHSVERLLQQESAKDLSDVIPLINQLMSTFKKEISPYMNEVFMLIVQTIFNKLNEEVAANDLDAVRDKTMLQKTYYLFLNSIMTNDLMDILTSEKNAPHLNTVLQTVIQGAIEGTDASAQKTCFGLMKHFVQSWAESVPGFKGFIVENVYSACWKVILGPSFKVNDAQSLLLLNEISSLQLAISKLCGPELVQFLQNGYFAELNFPAALMNEYSMLLQKDDKMPLRDFLKRIIAMKQ